MSEIRQSAIHNIHQEFMTSENWIAVMTVDEENHNSEDMNIFSNDSDIRGNYPLSLFQDNST